jgi:hypothetical protein
LGGQETKELVNVVGDDTLDGIVSFFSLTFFGKDEDTFNSMIQTIDSLLPPAGKFVGIVMDGQKVRELLNKPFDTPAKGELMGTANKQKFVLKDDVEVDDTEEGEEARAFVSPSFNIVQVSEFTENIAGNEIEITINDPTSMVKDQQEWLFDFEAMKNALSKRGIKLLRQGFLEVGDMFKILPNDSQIFSSLNRFFVFQRGESVARVGVSDQNIDKMVKFPNDYEEGLYNIGVVRDRSSFLHAIVRSFDPSYFSMDEEQRAAHIAKIRKALGRKLTRNNFEAFNYGHLAGAYINKAKKENKGITKSDAHKLAFLEYKLKIIDPNEFIGMDSALELISNTLNINIYVLRTDGKPIKPPGVKKENPEGCREFYRSKKSVVLYTKDNITFSLIGRKSASGALFTMFDSSDEFIAKLTAELCDE